MRPTRMPLGCSRSSMISPIGSGIAAICSQPRATVSIAAASSLRRSTSGAARPAPRARGDVAPHWPRQAPPRSRAAAAPARAARRCAPPPATPRGRGSPPAPHSHVRDGACRSAEVIRGLSQTGPPRRRGGGAPIAKECARRPRDRSRAARPAVRLAPVERHQGAGRGRGGRSRRTGAPGGRGSSGFAARSPAGR